MPTYFPLVVMLPFLIGVVIFAVTKFKSEDRDKFFYVRFLGLFSFVLFGLIITFLAIRTLKTAKDYSFNGVIQKAYYEKPKQIPYITIKGIEYDLGSLNYPDYDTIVVGDSAIKEKGTLTFRLIKKK